MFYDSYGQQMISITVSLNNTEITFPLGQNHGYRRQPGAVTVEAGISNVLPFVVELDINGDGSWTLRKVYTLANNQHANPFLHFAIDPSQPPTPGQIHTLSQWRQGENLPYGVVGRRFGSQVAEWAFGKDVAAIFAATNN